MTATLETTERSVTVVDLVRTAQAGDRAALCELLERSRPQVLAAAQRRMRNEHEAEELTQDVLVQVMEKLDQLRVPEAFGGWVRRIVHRMAINRIVRRPAATACDPDALAAACLSADTPVGVAVRREEAVGVHRGLSRLGELDRQTLSAFYLRGQTLLEMSDAFDAPVGTIKRRLHVARKRLAREVEELQAV